MLPGHAPAYMPWQLPPLTDVTGRFRDRLG